MPYFSDRKVDLWVGLSKTNYLYVIIATFETYDLYRGNTVFQQTEDGQLKMKNVNNDMKMREDL